MAQRDGITREWRSLLQDQLPETRQEPLLLLPDNRTLVCDEESTILRLIRRQAAPSPPFARGDDWKKVEHDLFAVILDNHDGRIRQATRKVIEVEEEDQVGEFLEPTDRWVIGLADADDFLVRFIATCRDPHSTQTIAKLITNLRDSCLNNLRKPHMDTIPDHILIQGFADQILKGLRVEAGDNQVLVGHGGGVKLADLLPLVPKNGL